MGLQYHEIADAALLTQEMLVKRGAFLDMQTDLQDHVAVREMWEGRKKVFEGGDPWRFDCQIDHNHSTRAVKLYETDGSAINDTMISGEIRPMHVNSHYTYDLREKAFQGGGTKIVDYIKTKYVAMQISFFEWLEPVLWSEPADDGVTPFGVGYWVTRSATTGFYGLDPTNFPSGKAGIDATTDSTRWRNWTARYIETSKEDLVRKMREASVKTRFRSPVTHSQPKLGGMRNGIYMNYATLALIEEALEDQNMNLGNDIASKDGRSLFKGSPLTYVPYLDADSTEAPVYLLDWAWMAIGVLAGWENQLTKPYMVPNKHLVRRVDRDCTLNMACTNLRRQAVISKAP